MTRFFVVFAPGHMGEACKVLSSHRTYRAALKRIQDTTTLVIRCGTLRKGETFFANNADYWFPYATGEVQS